MSTRVIVHVGPRKTGTTYLQRVLQKVAAEPGINGVLYPLAYRNHNHHNHAHAAFAIENLADQGADIVWDEFGTDEDTHPALIRAVNRHEGVSIVSSEALGGFRPEAVEMFLEGITGEIQVIVTARDIGRIFPSSWQQHLRNTHAPDYAAFLERRAVERELGPDQWNARRTLRFWRSYSYGNLVRRWEQFVGVGSVSVITVPPVGGTGDSLWERFRTACDLRDELPVVAPPIAPLAANTGSTEAEATFLLAFNNLARELDFSRRDVKRMIRRLLDTGILNRVDRGRPLLLPSADLERVQRWAREDIADLAQTGAPIFGNLDELIVHEDEATETPLDPDEVAAVGAHIAMKLLQGNIGRAPRGNRASKSVKG
jgi:hypothetical protein